MELSEKAVIKQGTFLTIKSSSTFYVVAKKVTQNGNEIKIFPERVYHLVGNTLYGPDYYKKPYCYSIEDFRKKVSITDEDTVNKIKKENN